MGLTTNNKKTLFDVEPFFDKIDLDEIPNDYIDKEQPNTNYNLKNKFEDVNSVDVMVYEIEPMTNKDMELLLVLRLVVSQYEIGQYKIGNFTINIKNKI
jgi:hypothetical protein